MPSETNEPGIVQAASDPNVSPSTATNAFKNVPIEITISVGHARPLIRDLMNLHRDQILALDRTIEEPVELYVGTKLIGRGELQEVEGGGGQLAVRLTEVADLADGI